MTTVTDYLLDRLAELGVRHVYGVPGDFTLTLLDHIENDDRIEWVGCANELGAGYAADGAARIGAISVVCTTFGVGELSAVNAVAGSFAEHVPVLHLVGSPGTTTQAAHRATHHTLGDGDFGHFARMSAEVTCAQGFVTEENAGAEIDRVLAEMLELSLPGYLSIPTDVGEAPFPPPATALPRHPGITDPGALDRFSAAASALLDGGTVAVLADILVHRMAAEAQLAALLSTGVPHATLLWGRRVVDESADAYLGSYVGAVSDPAVRAAIEGSDVLVSAGVQFTDLTSGFFSQHLDESRTIDVRPHAVSVAGVEFAPIHLRDALAALTGIIAAMPHRTPDTRSVPAPAPQSDETTLSQEVLWNAVADAVRPGDLVLADQGTSFYGMGTHRLPHDVVFIGQPLWASIGYTLPATLGAALTAGHRRPVLLIGDGAAQLTIAELGTLLRHRIPALIVVVQNQGYTVERAIHGRAAKYNDIARWDWVALVAALGPGADASGIRASTGAQLQRALTDAAEHPRRLTLIEAVVPALDVPPLLTALAAAAASANAVPAVLPVADPDAAPPATAP